MVHAPQDEVLTGVEVEESADDLLAPVAPPLHERVRFTLSRRWQKFLDDVNPHLSLRWIATGSLFFLYCLRIYYVNGFHIVSYALGIYILNLFIGFLTPLVDPEKEKKAAKSEQLDEEAEQAELPPPAPQADDYKPFIRRIPEFKWWLNVTRAVLISIVCTFLPFLDIPVFWPILLIYFIALTTLTMKNQIKHMWKHRYLPLVNVGKPRFK